MSRCGSPAATTPMPPETRRWVRDRLDVFVRNLSTEAPFAGQLATYALLRLWDDDDKLVGSVPELRKSKENDVRTFFKDALVDGRKPVSEKSASTVASKAERETRIVHRAHVDLVQAVAKSRGIGEQAAATLLRREPRLQGDNGPLSFLADHMGAMFNLVVGPDSTHGLPPQLKKHLRAGFLALGPMFREGARIVVNDLDAEPAQETLQAIRAVA